MPVAIIEDDNGMRDSLAVMFAVHGVDARGYGSAEDYLGDAEAPPPCLLVVDHHLPGMTGVDLIARLAAADKLPPAVLVSARLTPAIYDAAAAAGAIAVLEKPVEPTDLMRLLPDHP